MRCNNKIIIGAIAVSTAIVSCSSGNNSTASTSSNQLSDYVSSLKYYSDSAEAQASNKNQLLIPVGADVDLKNLQVNFYSDKNCSKILDTAKLDGGAVLKKGYYLTTDKANFLIANKFKGGAQEELSSGSMSVAYTFKNGNSTFSRCLSNDKNGEALAGNGGLLSAKQTQSNSGNPIACSSSSCQFAGTYTESLPVLTYQVSYPNIVDPSQGLVTGISGTYDLVVTNNSSANISLTGLQFTLRTDAALQDAPALTSSNLWGTYLSDVTQSVGQCYGINNGICDVIYDLTFGSTQTLAANGGSVSISGMPNGNSQNAGGSTAGGLPLYNDVAHNVYGYNSATSEVYSTTAYSIYNNLQNPNPNKMLGTYFTDWTNYSTPSGRMFPAESVGVNSFPMPYLNSVVYDLGYLNNGNVGLADNWADPTYLQEFSYLRAAHPWLDLAISFGGWGSGSGVGGYPSQDLQTVFEANNPALIQQTAANMINAAILYGFNGVDIDFEQGVCNVSTSWCVNGTLVLDSTSVQNYQALLSALHSYANAVTTESSGSPLFGTTFNISAALPVGVDAMQNYVALGGNYQTLLGSVTYGNLMAYDYHGQFDTPDGVTDALAGLYRSQYSYGLSNYKQYYDINDTLTCGTTANTCNGYLGYFAYAPNMASKLNLGIPTYTRVENLTTAASSNSTAMYQPLSSSQTWAAQGGGVVSYRCLYNSNYCAPAKGDDMPQSLTSSNLVAWNTSSAAMTPWFYYVVSGTSYFGTFDNGASAANKVNYANTQGLNGYFTWEVDEDIPMQDPNYAQYGITNNICIASGSCINQ